MTEETIVAVYDTAAHAEAAVQELREANVPASAISQHADTTSPAVSHPAVSQPATRQPGTAGQGFWDSLFGGEPDHDTAVYDRSLAAGSSVVSVKVPQQYIATVTTILERHSPIDIDDRAASYGLAPAVAAGPVASLPAGSAAVTANATAAESIKLAEERLTVGKRVVNRGGTRIRRFVVETPVEEQVTLRDEIVTIDRRPVTDGRPVADANFTDKTIEMTETREEAVIAKQAYVKEEVALRRAVKDRVETVRDTVRREDVEIEQIPGETVTPKTSQV